MTQYADSHPSHPITFPEKHVVGLIGDLPEAERAVQALQDAGYKAEEIHLFLSQQFITGIKEKRQKTNPFQGLIHRLVATSDEGFAGDWYLAEARQGHHILAVYAPDAQQVERVRALLVKVHAHGIKYFGTWGISNLP